LRFHGRVVQPVDIVFLQTDLQRARQERGGGGLRVGWLLGLLALGLIALYMGM